MKNLLNLAVKAAIESSKEVLKLYADGFSVTLKEDNSPVTTADLKAQEIIFKYLSETNIPILSEEGEKEIHTQLSKWSQYWCVDPIDGTKEFVNKTDEYCISIGLITPDTSMLGVLAAPSLGSFYFAADGVGSYKWKGRYEDLYLLLEKDLIIDELLNNSVCLKPSPYLKQNPYIFLTSRSHFSNVDEEYYHELKNQFADIKMIQMGSAVKIAWVAEGKAQEYARLSPVNFWDIAGGHAIAKYAGLEIVDYNSKDSVNYKNTENLKISGYILKNK
ncbi:3'(2'),5'-bisphosphate nucleotidase CysQ [Apibacter raozihei]|uniref:3'(2'),5'-bisphosphate nucleotidase CysQ family protein n=1 Tax=Apibacter raozihei TaxID=2500547 RepID=UPI000FE3ABFB|nr:3'(2'),5'-bisphosphate nucleotidase CysQ [Apibacter raozihei]